MAMVNIVSLILFLNIGFCLSCSEGIIGELLSRIKALEDRETVNAARIYHLENQVKINNEKYEILQQQNILLKNDQAVRTNKLDQVNRMATDLIKNIDGIKKNAENEYAVVDGLKETIIQIQKTVTSFVKAIQPYNNALVEQARTFSDSSEANTSLSIRNELSKSQANRNSTNDTILLGKTKEMLKLLDANLDTQYNRMTKRPRITRQSRQENSPVAFHAVLTEYVRYLGTDQIIKFDNVHLNAGNGYHNRHGLFIAPRSGIYLFSSSTTYPGKHDSWAELVKNGQVLAKILAGDEMYTTQGSVTVVTQLTAGDEVWVRHRHPPGGSIWGNNFPSFCGVLLIPE